VILCNEEVIIYFGTTTSHRIVKVTMRQYAKVASEVLQKVTVYILFKYKVKSLKNKVILVNK
jgi:hypothetical protein